MCALIYAFKNLVQGNLPLNLPQLAAPQPYEGSERELQTSQGLLRDSSGTP